MTLESGTVCQANTPLVTVVMAAYNCERYVGEAIESVRAQTYANWELLCIDDGSTDATREIVQQHASEDERIRLICNEHNLGPAAARNRGIEHASGDFIAILDSDDVACEDRFETCMEVFRQHPELDLLAGDAIEIDENSWPRGPWREVRGVHSSWMLRMEVIRAVGVYEPFLSPCEDADLLARVSVQHELGFLDHPLVKYRRHRGQLSCEHAYQQKLLSYVRSTRSQARARGEEVDLHEEYERLRADPQVQASCLYYQARAQVRTGQVAEARASLRKGIKLAPANVRSRTRLALTYFPEPLRSAIDGAWKYLGRVLQRRESVNGWPLDSPSVPVYSPCNERP